MNYVKHRPVETTPYQTPTLEHLRPTKLCHLAPSTHLQPLHHHADLGHVAKGEGHVDGARAAQRLVHAEAEKDDVRPERVGAALPRERGQQEQQRQARGQPGGDAHVARAAVRRPHVRQLQPVERFVRCMELSLAFLSSFALFLVFSQLDDASHSSLGKLKTSSVDEQSFYALFNRELSKLPPSPNIDSTPPLRLEYQQVMRTRRTQALILSPFFVSTKVALLLLFATVTALGGGHKFRSYTVFLTIGLITVLRLSCNLFMSFAFQNIAEMRVCLGRLESGIRFGCDLDDSG
ncbi:hypothetical protein EGW08_001194 [Elysia chlorotica]|uniref:Transmembrane protein n=1 Tax=Elysia chlorotica TaxID=188477 RepID=A0A433UB98_ELYCH|nr:hypothetical protein EGW08_001194 [Elysia chlorotica]